MKGKKVFLSREVPRTSLEFMIRSFGGEVSWEGRLDPIRVNNQDLMLHFQKVMRKLAIKLWTVIRKRDNFCPEFMYNLNGFSVCRLINS